MKITRKGTQVADVFAGAASYTLEEINGARIAYLEFAALEPVELTVNDAIEYEGETYYIRHREDVTKEETSLGFTYRVKFYHEMYRLHDVVAFMYKEPDFRKNMNKYNGTARQVLDIVVRSMNRVHPGWSLADCIETKAATFDLKDKTCAEVVSDLVAHYDSEFYVDGRAIYFGRREVDGSGLTYRQGPGGGFRSVTLSAVDETPPITRLYAYGSDKNMTGGEYLQLPGGKKFLEKNTEKYGIVEYVKQFDSIYPHGEFKVTARVDAFTLQASGIDFDLTAQLIDGVEPVVTFQDGGLAGYDLNIVKGTWDAKKKQFRLAKNEQEEALKVPGDIHFAVGDTFTLTGIKMPKAYVDKASEELRVAAQKWLDGKCENQMRLAVTCDEVLFAAEGRRVVCGEMLYVTDRLLAGSRKIRVTSVKKYIENDGETPYRYELVLSDFLDGNRFMQDVRDLKDESKRLKARQNELERYARRQWRDVKETQEEIKKDFSDKFKESINPVTVETMQLIVGHEQLQFVFVNSRTQPQTVVSLYPQIAGGKVRLSAAGLYLKHMTMGIKTLSSARDAKAYRYWAMPNYTSPMLDKDKVYRLYARVPVGGEAGTFVVSDSKRELSSEAGYYHLLMGYIGREVDGNRSWGRTYGFTEVLPGQITTELIQDPNARLVIDLVNGRITGPVHITAGSGYNNLSDKPDLSGFQTKADFQIEADKIHGEVGQVNTKLGGTQQQLESLQTWSQGQVQSILNRQNTADDKIYRLQTAGFLTTAQGNALYASAELADGTKIASYITQSPTAINMISRNINIDASVTFGNFKEDNAQKLAAVNRRVGNAESAISQKQGKNDVFDINRARLNGQTVIEKGYIKTSLINTKAIQISDGTSLGGFYIEGNNISAKGWKWLNDANQALTQGAISLSPQKGFVACQYFPGGGAVKTRVDASGLIIEGAHSTRVIDGKIITDEFEIVNKYANCSVKVARIENDPDWHPYVQLCLDIPHKNHVNKMYGSHNYHNVLWDEKTKLLCWE
ncbi:hypothetical protein BHU09_06480 [Tannerella sp. oral taxon 808]|nr:hypothetical protein BHU09_06480 [Tannerella sp. oral taxon 808]